MLWPVSKLQSTLLPLLTFQAGLPSTVKSSSTFTSSTGPNKGFGSAALKETAEKVPNRSRQSVARVLAIKSGEWRKQNGEGKAKLGFRCQGALRFWLGLSNVSYALLWSTRVGHKVEDRHSHAADQ